MNSVQNTRYQLNVYRSGKYYTRIGDYATEAQAAGVAKERNESDRKGLAYRVGVMGAEYQGNVTDPQTGEEFATYTGANI